MEPDCLFYVTFAVHFIFQLTTNSWTIRIYSFIVYSNLITKVVQLKKVKKVIISLKEI